MKTFFKHLCLLAILSSVSLSVSADEVSVADAWVRAAPPNAPALAAFMQVHNQSASAISIVGVRTSFDTERVEMHRTMMVNGVMKMQPQKAIPVEAHSSTTLKPGSWHIMLIKPVEVPKPGDVIDLTLVLGNGHEQQVSATVRKGMNMAAGEMSHKHENKMQAD